MDSFGNLSTATTERGKRENEANGNDLVDVHVPKGFVYRKEQTLHVVDPIEADIHSDTDRNVILSPSSGRSSISISWDLPVCHRDIVARPRMGKRGR